MRTLVRVAAFLLIVALSAPLLRLLYEAADDWGWLAAIGMEGKAASMAAWTGGWVAAMAFCRMWPSLTQSPSARG